MGALNSSTPESGRFPGFVADAHDPRGIDKRMEVTLLPDTANREDEARREVPLDSPQGNLLALAAGIAGMVEPPAVEPAPAQAVHDQIVSFLWGIADDILRDAIKRAKYPDVILPMCVLGRLDAVLEPRHQSVIEIKQILDQAGITEQHAALCQAAGKAFYNSSKFTLRGLNPRASQRQLRRNFEAYLDGFSPNVQDILDNFRFRKQVATLSRAEVLGPLIDTFLDPDLNLAGLDNQSMGAVFEELVRRFNVENIAEAGEHLTPGDLARLMANLVILPVAGAIESGSYHLYDGACGTGSLLTAAEDTLRNLAGKNGKRTTTHLYGQETDPRTYAIFKASMLLKGEDDHAEHIAGGVERSTISRDAFPAHQFDFLISHPPFGSWRKDLDLMGGKEGVRDSRFKIAHGDDPDYSLVTRPGDGQMLFLANLAGKMNRETTLGSRIVEVHDDSSLLTGDAGQGESNIRRWIIENDWLEAIIALPGNLLYHTGVATYLWILSNHKAEPRRGKVQLIDATEWSRPIEEALGEKKRELSGEDIHHIGEVLLGFESTAQSKILPNEAFGYWKVTVERPLRLRSQLTRKGIEPLRFASGDEALRSELFQEFGDRLLSDFQFVRPAIEKRLTEAKDGEEDAKPDRRLRKVLDPATWKKDNRLFETALALQRELGDGLFADHNHFRQKVEGALARLGTKLSGAELKLILRAASWREAGAPPVIAKVHKRGKIESDPLHGIYQQEIGGVLSMVEYEPDPELRESKRVPLLEPGGIEAFCRREVLPHDPDAWVDQGSAKIGYEISFSQDVSPAKKVEELTTTPAWKKWEGDLAGPEFPLDQFLAATENGAVFRTRCGPDVAAIKLVPAGNVRAQQLVERWNRASALEHPNLIKILRTGIWVKDGTSLAYVVMEYAEENLETTLTERVLTAGETLEMLQPVAEVLTFLHGRGLVHAHLKPSNIFAAKDTVKISSDGLLVGDSAADLRALAAIIVEGLTQQAVTFTGGDAETGVIDRLPKALQEITRNCIGQNGRPQWSAAILADALRSPQPAAPGINTATLPVRPMRVYRYKRKTPRLTYYLMSLALLAVTVLTFGSVWRHRTVDSIVAAPEASPKPLEVAASASPAPVPVRKSRPQQVIDPLEQVTRKVYPDIPGDAQRTIRGKAKILVKVEVDPSGKVTDAALENSGGSPFFGKLALEAAQKWRFIATDNGASREWLLRFEITPTETKIVPQQSAER